MEKSKVLGFKNLQITAKELNTVLDPDPAIRYVGVTKDKIIEDIKRAANLLMKTDCVEPLIKEVLNELGIDCKASIRGETDDTEEKKKVVKTEKAVSTSLFRKDSKYDYVYNLLKEGGMTLSSISAKMTDKCGEKTGSMKNIHTYVHTIKKKLLEQKISLEKDGEGVFHIG